MSEKGIYFQTGFVGLAAGWDDVEGFTVSFFASGSVGVSADMWQAVNFSFDNPYLIEFEKEQYYAGIGTASGTPGPTFNVQQNWATGDAFVTSGFAASNDVALELGFYWEGDVFPQTGPNWDWNPEDFVVPMPILTESISELSDYYDAIPPEQLGLVLAQGLEDFTRDYRGAATGVSADIWLGEFLSGEMEASQEFFAMLDGIQDYWLQNGNNMPDPPIVPPTTTTPPDDGDDGTSDGGDGAATTSPPSDKTGVVKWLGLFEQYPRVS